MQGLLGIEIYSIGEEGFNCTGTLMEGDSDEAFKKDSQYV